jgi:hypothetical protein
VRRIETVVDPQLLRALEQLLDVPTDRPVDAARDAEAGRLHDGGRREVEAHGPAAAHRPIEVEHDLVAVEAAHRPAHRSRGSSAKVANGRFTLYGTGRVASSSMLTNSSPLTNDLVVPAVMLMVDDTPLTWKS